MNLSFPVTARRAAGAALRVAAALACGMAAASTVSILSLQGFHPRLLAQGSSRTCGANSGALDPTDLRLLKVDDPQHSDVCALDISGAPIGAPEPASALLARMKYITRWSLMHSTRAESLSEHTCDTALLAHMLCLIARRYTGTPCRPKTVAVAALYHDAPEINTGDMPTPVKYSSPTLRDAYKALETESVRCMTGLLPDELSEELSPFISGELLTAEEKRLLKAADRLSALIKCTEEQRSGNHEFDAALAQQKAALQAMHCPEADWFIEHCLPCYTQNLDELTRQQ